MERTKRRHDNTVQDNNGNKKRKLQNQIILTNKSCLEHLPNEILYEIFDYLDLYHVYRGFFHVNKRFKNLLVNSNISIQINTPIMSKSNFECYYKDFILPNKHRINQLFLSNPFTVDLVFSPPRIISKFVHLETLVLDNINGNYLNKILDYLVVLPNLHSLIIHPIDYILYPTILFDKIFRLHQLKYSKITYQTKDGENPFSIYFSEYDSSPIEYLVINTHFPIDSLNNLLHCLPKLRHLSINSLVNSHYIDDDGYPIVSLTDLKYVSLKIVSINFNAFEIVIKNFFHHVEVLRISTKYSQAYLDAQRWERVILSYMPNLRIFDIDHEGIVRDNQLTFHDFVKQFNSSFWMERQWFFTHQHNWQKNLNSAIFYSTDPYRRNDYTFYWELDEQLCSHLKETNLGVVKHVHICGRQAMNHSVNYFSNATELTIKHYFKTPDDSITITLARTIPLKQLTKLTIESYDFPFEQIVELLCYTPNLRELKFSLLSLYETNSKLIKQSESFQHVLKTNKIINLELRGCCSLEKFQLVIHLFPQIEYLTTGMNRKEIGQIIRYLFSKTKKTERRLLFLRISDIPKICLKELNVLIKAENLLDDYFIKFIKRDLYLWW